MVKSLRWFLTVLSLALVAMSAPVHADQADREDGSGVCGAFMLTFTRPADGAQYERGPFGFVDDKAVQPGEGDAERVVTTLGKNGTVLRLATKWAGQPGYEVPNEIGYWDIRYNVVFLPCDGSR